jgi:hypothetical protein
VTGGLRDFADRLATVNASARILLTVSPVPLIATYTREHVLVATTHSKAILRAACSELEVAYQSVYYFPSYEIVSSVYTCGAYYNTNMRTVTQEGIDRVMAIFQQTYFSAPDTTGARVPTRSESSTSPTNEPDLDMPVCDEEEIVRSIGFS